MCIGKCAHWYNPISQLVADLGTIGEHIHLEHFAYVGSYVDVAWPDA